MIFIYLYQFDYGISLWQVFFNSFCPFNKTPIARVEVFFKAYIKSLFLIFDTVEIEVLNLIISAFIRVHQTKSRAADIIGTA